MLATPTSRTHIWQCTQAFSSHPRGRPPYAGSPRRMAVIIWPVLTAATAMVCPDHKGSTAIHSVLPLVLQRSQNTTVGRVNTWRLLCTTCSSLLGHAGILWQCRNASCPLAAAAMGLLSLEPQTLRLCIADALTLFPSDSCQLQQLFKEPLKYDCKMVS